MENSIPKTEHKANPTLVETLETELNIDKHKAEKSVIDVITCNIRADIDTEIDKILKEVRSNITFGVILKIVFTLILCFGLIFLLVNWIFF